MKIALILAAVVSPQNETGVYVGAAIAIAMIVAAAVIGNKTGGPRPPSHT